MAVAGTGSAAEAQFFAGQKQQDMLGAFWPRKISRHFTRMLVRTPITPNQTTIAWGILSVLNSYPVYLALTGHWWAIPLIPVIYQLAFVFDCVDGEIARLKQMSNPIGGKLLDGVCHRATEFALLGTFGVAAYAAAGSLWAVAVGMLLVTGDAMSLFVYERRLTALRVQAGFKGQIRLTAAGVYQRGARWGDLTRRQQILTLTGLFHYKSVYGVIVLSYLSPHVFVGGLGALAAYKHWKWLRLMRRTLADVVRVQADAVAAASTPTDAKPKAAASTSGTTLTRSR